MHRRRSRHLGRDASFWAYPCLAQGAREEHAGSLSKEATRFASPAVSSIMRLGISPTMLKTVSRRFGLPGLALSAGISGYEMYQNKKAGRGLFDDG